MGRKRGTNRRGGIKSGWGESKVWLGGANNRRKNSKVQLLVDTMLPSKKIEGKRGGSEKIRGGTFFMLMQTQRRRKKGERELQTTRDDYGQKKGKDAGGVV